MYTVNKTRSRKKILLLICLVVFSIVSVLCVFVWFKYFRDLQDSRASFESVGGNTIAVIEPATTTFTTNKFEVTLPEGWIQEDVGSVAKPDTYYSYKSEIEGYENRWLKIYVDKIPDSYPLTRVLEASVNDNNKIDAGGLSGDCKSFQGAPKPGTQSYNQAWNANWQGIEFICNMSGTNHIGAANSENNTILPITGASGSLHNYFFVYVDHNIRPDYTILSKALESFVAL